MIQFTTIWKTQDERFVEVIHMDYNHLQNTINYLQRHLAEREPIVDDDVYRHNIRVLLNEQDRRRAQDD